MIAIQQTAKHRKSSSWGNVALSGFLALGIVTTLDEVVSFKRVKQEQDSALQPMLDSTIRDACKKSDLLNKKVSYATEAPFGIFAPTIGKALGFKLAGDLVTKDIEIQTTTVATTSKPNSATSQLTIVAEDPETGFQYRATNPKPSAECLAAALTAG